MGFGGIFVAWGGFACMIGAVIGLVGIYQGRDYLGPNAWLCYLGAVCAIGMLISSKRREKQHGTNDDGGPSACTGSGR